MSDGDLARVIELLLLENHVLMQHQSVGFRRGVPYEFSEFPRFLHFEDEASPASQSDEDQRDSMEDE